MKRLLLRLCSVLVLLVATPATLDATAHAAPLTPAAGDRVQLTLRSDSARNVASGWVDSANHSRVQRNPVLTTFDATSRRWSSTLTFTARAALTDLTVYLQTGGGFAGCTVTVNGIQIAHAAERRRRAVAVCRSAAGRADPPPTTQPPNIGQYRAGRPRGPYDMCTE